MAEKKKKNETEETTGNVVLKKFKKDQTRDDKNKKWRKVEDAVQSARRAYVGSFEPNNEEKTVSFEKALGDLIEVLQKIKGGDIELGGLTEETGVELPAEG
jgi:hypothetical protein